MKNNKGVLIAISAIAILSIVDCAIAQENSVNESQIIQEAKEKLVKVKTAVQYRYVTDGPSINRSLGDVIQIFKETKADFIFQGWLTQYPLPENCADLNKHARKQCESAGYSYELSANAISEIKKELPEVIFCGGTQFEYLYPGEVSGKNDGERRDKAWDMSLNPQKWGFQESRTDMQYFWAKKWGIVENGNSRPSEKELKSMMRHYFPDITNPDFQEVFLKRIFRQIDAGADAIWIDMLYVQPAVQESYKAVWDIVDKIHKYGLKRGKYIYVITWVAGLKDGDITVIPKTNVDIAMLSASADEIFNRNSGKIGDFNAIVWQEVIGKINNQLGIPIFARIDYGGNGRSPLEVFSQELTQDESQSFLAVADDFFKRSGITFIYPVHGGDMGPKDKIKKLSYGKFNWYDALAPEFDTYETIKQLTNAAH